MIEKLEYPLDTSFIMRKRKKMVKELQKKEKLIEKKVAILGGSTTFDIKETLNLFLLNEGIKATFYESEYNKYYEDALFSENLEKFNPEIIYIHTSYRNIDKFPELNASKKDINALLEREYNKYLSIWDSLQKKFSAVIIQNNMEYPKNRLMGNSERSLGYGKIKFIDRLNIKISDYAEDKNNFFINDINYLSARIGLDKWHDLGFYYNYKYVLSYEAIPYLCKSISLIIKSLYGKNKKGIVLDLDNTLWGGVIGDDGVNGISIGKETSLGEAYTEFQKYIKELKKMGIVLAIASKNEEEIAKQGLNHSDMILKEEDFYSIKANWEPKNINIEDIAKEINIGQNSLIFLDDNPFERETVKKYLPDVKVPEIGENIENYIEFIDRNGYFEVTNMSEEDLKRNEYYIANKNREENKKTFENYEEFLLSLNMEAEIELAKPIYYERIAQLTNKTNQFNLTTRRYSLEEIKEVSNDKNKVLVYGRLKDKFGDNGLITVVIGELKDKVLYLDLWLMSCRVLKRNMEEAMFDFLIEFCKENKISKIHGYYKKTNKNNMVKDHYLNLGFKKISGDEDFNEWELLLEKINKKNKVIKIKE